MCNGEGYDGAVVDTVSFWCPLCLCFIAGKSGQLGVFFSLTDDQGVFGPFHVALFLDISRCLCCSAKTVGI